MTIAEQILRIKDNISSAYAKAEEKGATMPEVLNSDNLPSTIESITGGGGEGGDFLGIGNFMVVDGVAEPITNLDVSNVFKNITTIVANGMNNACNNKKGIYGEANFANLTSIGAYGLSNAFNECWYLTSANFPKLTDASLLSFSNAFRGSGVGSVNFPNLVNAYGAFYMCFRFASITSASFPSLAYANNECFRETFHGCDRLTSVSFPNLTTGASGGWGCFYNTFANCYNLAYVDFSNISNVTFNHAFSGNAGVNAPNGLEVDFSNVVECSCNGILRSCNSIRKVEFPKLETAGDMGYSFLGCKNIQTANFPMLKTANNLTYFLGQCPKLESVDFSNLVSVNTAGRMFEEDTNITSLSFPNLETINLEVAFFCYRCTNLVSASFPKLGKGQMFSGSFATAFGDCSNLTTVDFSSIENLVRTGNNNASFSNAFINCKSLTSFEMPNLVTINSTNVFANAFKGCTNLSSVRFPSFTNAGTYQTYFNNMLSGCSNVTVHFRADMESTLSSWTSVRTGFSGTNTTVLFDL